MANLNVDNIPDNLMLELLKNHIKDKLTDILMETAKKEIEVVVIEAVKSMEYDLDQIYDPIMREKTIKIILEDKRNGKR